MKEFQLRSQTNYMKKLQTKKSWANKSKIWYFQDRLPYQIDLDASQ